MFDVDKLNKCMLMSLRSQKHCDLFDRGIKMMADFSREHQIKKGTAFFEETEEHYKFREPILAMMMDDLYSKMFKNESSDG